jgi:D-alanyl-D-alanine carboxypeptidase/D-alanyl-D-alanine-endopeptidase (penicillin-binding protein 4)
MGITMKFEKLLLVSLGVVFSFPMAFSLQATEKSQSIEAIWNSIEQKSKQKTRADQAKKEDTKLARQRAIWKAKWDAEQKAKKLAVPLQKPVMQRKAAKTALNLAKPTTETGLILSPAELALANQTPVWKQQTQPQGLQTKTPKKVVKHRAPKPLTREQYQSRWKKQQLEKQKQIVQGNLAAPLLSNADTNKFVNRKAQKQLSRAAFRSNSKLASLSSLPFEVQHKLRAAKLNTKAMSAYVRDVSSNRPLLGHQDKTSRVPASVMKLITSYAALGTLGPDYRWPLDVYTRGAIKKGTLKGDLIIKGYGSPEFNKAELRKVLQGIKHKGISNVSGRVVFDNSYFNVPNEGSLDGKSQSAYNAQPDALLYNERLNSFQIRASGKKVHVSSTTPTHNLKIVNRMRTVRRGCRPHIKVSHQGAQTVVTFSGRYSRRCGTRTYNRVISRPAEMIYGAMQAMWKRDVGGKLNTQFAMGTAPAGTKPLLRTHSRTLAEILPMIDKDSNNVMARQVMLTIGARASGQGTEQSGANAIGAWLASRGLNFPELRIENGSGLSRHARISARHVGDLLVDAYRSPYRTILMRSLAVAGVDGTMKRRLKGSQVRGRGFFKTGSLRDVRSIAGYVKAADGKTYVMAILHNDPRAPRRALAAHDKLIEWVYSGGRQEQIASVAQHTYN